MNICCVKCQVAFTPYKSGVNAIEMSDDFGPYRVWWADVRVCLGGGARIVTGFSKVAVGHWDADFEAALAEAEADPDTVRIYEKPFSK